MLAKISMNEVVVKFDSCGHSNMISVDDFTNDMKCSMCEELVTASSIVKKSSKKTVKKDVKNQ